MLGHNRTPKKKITNNQRGKHSSWMRNADTARNRFNREFQDGVNFNQEVRSAEKALKEKT